jgi:hypothetical protein
MPTLFIDPTNSTLSNTPSQTTDSTSVTLNQDILATVPKVANDPYWSNRANWTKIAIYYKSDRRRNGLSYDAAAGSSSRSLQVIKQDGETLNVKYVVIFNTSKKYLVIRPTDVDMNYASVYIRPTATPATPDASGVVLTASDVTTSSMTISFTAAVDGGKPDTPQDALKYKLVRSTSSDAIDTIPEADAISSDNVLIDYSRMTFSASSTGLAADTNYYYSLLVENGADQKALSSVFLQRSAAYTNYPNLRFYNLGTNYLNTSTVWVRDIKFDSDYAYMSGMFNVVEDKRDVVNYGAMINRWNTGVSFSTNFDSTVHTVVQDGDYVFVAGSFTSYNGVAANGLAKINIITGALDTSFVNYLPSGASVVSLLIDGNNLYLGGIFTSYNGKTRQRLVKVNKSTGTEIDADGSGFSTTTGFAGTVSGSVGIYALALQGSDLYVGGNFTTYKGLTRNYLVKINKTSAAEVDTLNTGYSTTTGFNDWVWALAIRSDNILYCGGSFTSYKGTTRNRLVALSSGSIVAAFDTSVGCNSAVYALAFSGQASNVLYVGGAFGAYRGSTRNGLLKLDTSNGNEVDTSGTGFSNPSLLVSTSTVNSLYTLGSAVFVGGKIGSIERSLGAYPASLPRSGCLILNEQLSLYGEFHALNANSPEGYFCSAAGPGLSVVTQSTQNIFRPILTAVTGTVISSSPTTTISLNDHGLYTNDPIFISNNLCKVTVVDSNTFTIDIILSVGSVTFNKVNSYFVGGNLTSYVAPAKGLVRTSLTTGRLDSNYCRLLGQGFGNESYVSAGRAYERVRSVSSLALDGNTLYAAGSFVSFKDKNRQGLVKLNKITLAEIDTDTTGFSTTSAFDRVGGSYPNSSSNPLQLRLLLDGNNLYVSGSFNTYKGSTRWGVVKIDKNTGAEVDTSGTGFSVTNLLGVSVGEWPPAPVAALIDGNNLYICGSFNTLRGVSRYGIVKINKNTAAEVDTSGTGFSVTSPLFTSPPHAMLIDIDNLYVAGSFTQYNGATRGGIVKINKNTAAEVDTSGTGFSTTSGLSRIQGDEYAMVCLSDALYICGPITAYKGATRGGIVKINKNTAAEVDTSGTGFSVTSGFAISLQAYFCMQNFGSSLFVGFHANSSLGYRGTSYRGFISLNKTDGTVLVQS